MTTLNTYLFTLEKSMTDTPYSDGKTANIIHLINNNAMTVSLMDIGATWLSCTLPMPQAKQSIQRREVLLRMPNMQQHIQHSAYLGATIGRYANRIANGRFDIKGTKYQLDINNGKNALHGGLQGFDKCRWKICAKSKQAVTFALTSKAHCQGYPGNMQIEVTYTLNDENELNISYQARTDATCPINLTNHAYFNLSGTNLDRTGTAISALEQKLQIHAKHYLPITENLIPTGQIKNVAKTSFDFRQLKTLKADFLQDSQQQLTAGYDHYFVFDKKLRETKSIVASLYSANQDLCMHIKTSQPGMQLYTGNFLAGNADLNNYDAIALETQYFADAVNQTSLLRDLQLNSPLLKPGQSYQQHTSYQFVNNPK